jgi:hypothetical protein
VVAAARSFGGGESQRSADGDHDVLPAEGRIREPGWSMAAAVSAEVEPRRG